jgi:ribonuclease HII
LIEERKLWAVGRARVAGLDEAGAGPWAGPVYAACVVLDPGSDLDLLIGVDDSKKLSADKRAALAVKIKAQARGWSVAEASVAEIDQINIRNAGLLAMVRALRGVVTALGPVDHLLLDARELSGTEIPQSSFIKGDSRCLSIAAASILAKVSRDAFMEEAARSFPHHGFERHKGYGTAEHRAAIDAHGVTPLHRRSFEPIRTFLGLDPTPQMPLFRS